MMGWLTASGLLGLKNWIWLLLALLLALGTFAVIAIADNAFEDTIETSKRIGAAEAISAGQETTLDQIGDATHAGNEIRNDHGDRKYRQCLHDSAPGYEGSCERYKPHVAVPGRPPAPD